MIVLWSAGAGAQAPPEKPQADKQKTETQQSDKDKPKEPAPPLFPRHRRGLYRNAKGVEVIDATPQSPPLEIDDPGTPDKGEYEINVTTHADYATAAQRYNVLSIDANYGILPVIGGYKVPTQIKFEFPVAAAREAGEPFNVGLGAANFGLKFNFYRDEHRGISVSVYPQVEFAAPGGRGVEKGLAETGQTVILPLLVAREFHDFTFVFNGAIEQPVHDPDRDTASEFGVGFGRAFTRKVAAMIELRTESSLDFKSNRLIFVNVGVIHGVRNIIVYANVGHSLFADDSVGHTYAGAGMKLLIDSKKKSATTALTSGRKRAQPERRTCGRLAWHP
jgi:hypothetical protein